MEYKMVNVTQIKPHPINDEIYGDSYDQELYDSIEREGILTPLRITKQHFIVSGHRRHAVALELGIFEVPVVYSEQEDDLLIQREIIEANRQREKDMEMKAREYRAVKRIESELAKRRMSDGGGDKKSGMANLPEPIENTGTSRDKAAEQVGMKPKTAETAAKVVDTIDRLKKTGHEDKAQELKEKLNKSVSGAAKEAKLIEQFLPPEPEPEPTPQPTPEPTPEPEPVPVSSPFPTFAPAPPTPTPAPPTPAPTPAPRPKAKATFNQTTDSIEWAKWTWNPVTGCLHDCAYCYARDITKRYPDGFPNGFAPTFYQERLDAPFNTKLPATKANGARNVFVCSMADLFGEWVETSWIEQVLHSCEQALDWTFIFLTKNPKRLIDFNFPENAWVGTTVDVQERVAPAVSAFMDLDQSENRPTVLFLSCEPMLERLDFGDDGLTPFDWVIIGACSSSSGMPASQPDFEWVEDLSMKAKAAGCKRYWKPNLKCRPTEYPINE